MNDKTIKYCTYCNFNKNYNTFIYKGYMFAYMYSTCKITCT